MESSHLNHRAIWIIGLLGEVVSTIYYSPLLLGHVWIRATGQPEAVLTHAMPVAFAAAISAQIVVSYTLALVLRAFKARSFGAGLRVGAGLWLGLVAWLALNDVLFANRPVDLYAINVGCHLVVVSLEAGLLAWWSRRAAQQPARAIVGLRS